MLTYALGLLGSKTAAIPRNGLVGEWLFSGNANDTSGSGYNGTVTGATLTTDRHGVSNSAYDFNGSTDYIQLVGSSALGTVFDSDFTISIWYNINVLQAAQLFDFRESGTVGWRGFIYGPANSYKSGYDFRGSLTSLNYINSSSVWVHLIIMRDSGVHKHYFNTVQDSITYSSADPQLNYTTDIKLATRSYSTPITFFSGKIDDIRIYNRTLTLPEINALYNE